MFKCSREGGSATLPTHVIIWMVSIHKKKRRGRKKNCYTRCGVLEEKIEVSKTCKFNIIKGLFHHSVSNVL